METNIWLVIEQGAGVIHKAFEIKQDAEKFVEWLKADTGFDCFEIQALDLICAD
jgi:hypothetical protein